MINDEFERKSSEAISNDKITLEKIIEAREKMNEYGLGQINDKAIAAEFNNSFPPTLGELKIYEHRDPPKLQLNSNINVSDEFRKEFNNWLIARFGYKESLFGDNEAYYIANYGVVMKPEQIAMLRNIL